VGSGDAGEQRPRATGLDGLCTAHAYMLKWADSLTNKMLESHLNIKLKLNTFVRNPIFLSKLLKLTSLIGDLNLVLPNSLQNQIQARIACGQCQLHFSTVSYFSKLYLLYKSYLQFGILGYCMYYTTRLHMYAHCTSLTKKIFTALEAQKALKNILFIHIDKISTRAARITSATT
jgi:hypothetical protein